MGVLDLALQKGWKRSALASIEITDRSLHIRRPESMRHASDSAPCCDNYDMVQNADHCPSSLSQLEFKVDELGP